MAVSSTATTAIAIAIATWKLEIKNGSVCPRPPAVVIMPMVAPRIHGEPRPVSEPSSEPHSAKPMEMPAPMLAAKPTRKASALLCVTKAVANKGVADVIGLSPGTRLSPDHGSFPRSCYPEGIRRF